MPARTRLPSACPQVLRVTQPVRQDGGVARRRLVTSDDWPEAELRAAVLAGELVAVGPCWASPAEPQTATLRAAAIAWSVRDPRLVAGTRTAAWIWGGLSRPPSPLEVTVPPSARVHAAPGIRIREVRLDAGDVVVLAGQPVTTPERTAVDLLRAPGRGAESFEAADAVAVGGLLGVGAVGAADVRARLGALGRVPMVRQAERRLRDVERTVATPSAAAGISPR